MTSSERRRIKEQVGSLKATIARRQQRIARTTVALAMAEQELQELIARIASLPAEDRNEISPAKLPWMVGAK